MTLSAEQRDLEVRRTALAEARVVLVSACLLGAACRYDGGAKALAKLREILATKEVVPLCPEAAAGLGVPRPKVELKGGTGAAVWRGEARAVTVDGGEDRSDAFREGAQFALSAVALHGATVAILKEKSPSCGSRKVYVSGELREGEGITTALLRSRGVVVLSDEEL